VYKKISRLRQTPYLGGYYVTVDTKNPPMIGQIVIRHISTHKRDNTSHYIILFLLELAGNR